MTKLVNGCHVLNLGNATGSVYSFFYLLYHLIVISTGRSKHSSAKSLNTRYALIVFYRYHVWLLLIQILKCVVQVYLFQIRSLMKIRLAAVEL